MFVQLTVIFRRRGAKEGLLHYFKKVGSSTGEDATGNSGDVAGPDATVSSQAD